MCRFCKAVGNRPIFDVGDHILDVTKDGLRYCTDENGYDFNIPINYCPMCGEKLGGDT